MKYVIYSNSLEKYIPVNVIKLVEICKDSKKKIFRLLESLDHKLWFVLDSSGTGVCESEFKTYAQECLERFVNEA